MALVLSPPQSSHADDPWHRFTKRNDPAQAHRPEDWRLCSTQHSIAKVIQRFMEHGYTRLTEAIPHQHRVLREFLQEADFTQSSRSSRPIDADIHLPIFNTGIAGLLEDRHDHAPCEELVGSTCSGAVTFSESLSTSMLYENLHEQRLARKAERRVLFVPDMTSATALVLASASAIRSAIPLRDMMHRYLTRDCIFSVKTGWGFFLEFHVPYYAMRVGRRIEDRRTIAGKQLRKSEVLPLQRQSKDAEELCYYEAQISSLCWGPDESFWTEIFLVETFFGSEVHYEKYLKPEVDLVTDLTLRLDPPTLTNDPNLSLDPREYWLRQLEVRLSQVVHEYTALIGTFSKRMEIYARSPEFMSDRSGHTQTLSDVLETIQNFSDSISTALDAWGAFQKTQMSFFAPRKHNSDEDSKPVYARLLNNISRSIGELERLRSVLLTQRAKFKSRIENFHTVSSLSQTETAIMQGENIRILTQMTVYVAFPLLFTAAIFSMDFVKPRSDSLAWGLFFTVFTITSLLNGTIAWLLHKSLIQKAFNEVFAFVRRMPTEVPIFVQHLFSGFVDFLQRQVDRIALWWKRL